VALTRGPTVPVETLADRLDLAAERVTGLSLANWRILCRTFLPEAFPEPKLTTENFKATETQPGTKDNLRILAERAIRKHPTIHPQDNKHRPDPDPV